MDMQLQDKVVVVTGASKGIGLAVARGALAEGALVVAASRSITPELDELVGDRLIHVVADFSGPDAPAEVIARAVEAFGGLDVLVNNVGGPSASGPHGSFLDVDDATWTQTLDFNVLSVVRTTRAALPLLLEGDGGAIVNVSSVNARQPFTAVVDYSAAKAALSNLGKALSEEYAPQGVRVNTVSPGPVRTPLWEGEGSMAVAMAAQSGGEVAQVLDEVLPEAMGLSTGRFASPDEVAHLVLLLASPLSASTTGAEMVLDSGLSKAL